MKAHVNIGSNLGDSSTLVIEAADAVERALGTPVARSATVTSPPWGYSSPHPYVNMGISFDTDLGPCELLDRLLAIERAISPASHRDDTGNYADRLIDIDLIALGDTVIDSPRLTLPHPRMHLRPFVLIPMSQLDPTWRHPVIGLTAAAMLERLHDQTVIIPKTPGSQR